MILGDYNADPNDGDSVDDEGFRSPKKGEANCGGFLIFNEKVGNSTQMMRIAERLGLYSPERAKNQDAVFDSLRELMASCDDAEEVEEITPCTVADPGCEAPAGFQNSNGTFEGEDSAEFECAACGDPVCGTCSTEVKVKRKKTRLCNYCREHTAP